MTDKEIAEHVLQLIQKHEASWDEAKGIYAKGKLWQDNIGPFLKKHKKSAFALTLDTFGWQYVWDVKDICEKVSGDNNIPEAVYPPHEVKDVVTLKAPDSLPGER